jgi:chemotaxis protein methyltransferase CheR
MALAQRSAAAVPASIPSPESDREFAFSDADFRSLARLAYEYAGIALADSKRNLVYTRLSRRLRALGLASFRDYRNHLASTESELEQFINAISTNLTRFFREGHHFDHFRAHIAAPFSTAMPRSAGSRLRVWSAGCSTGEEAYTIAIVLAHQIRDIAQHDVRILATDIDTAVLAKGMGGEYALSGIGDIPTTYREYFRASGNGGDVVMDGSVRSLIRFGRLNLMESWPFRGKFDAIFCRNVMIYFDNPTKAQIVDRFTQQLQPGGFLYIGHSESLMGSHPGLRLVGRTVYRREA